MRWNTWGWTLALLYGLSGLTALAYQVLWARMLGLQFGVSIFGVVVTVAAFMAGLGAGSLVGVRVSARTSVPLYWYAGLEGAVALFALLSPHIFHAVDGALNNLAAGLSLNAWYLTQGTATLVLLLIPATALGMTFPLMLKSLAVARFNVAELYGINTAGGVLGALLPLWLLPVLGWTEAIQTVAALSFVIAVMAALLATAPAARLRPDRLARSIRPAARNLFAYALVGAAALMLEVAWTRLLGMILLRTEYVLALILAVFLLGIGLGSLMARRMQHPAWFTLLPLASAGFAVLSLWFVPWTAAWAEQGNFHSLLHALTLQGLALTALTLPVTLALGAWLPLLAQRLGGDSGPWLYGVNALGAALGAIVAGTVLMPLFGAPTTVGVAALLLLLCGAVWITPHRAHFTAWGAGAIFIALMAWPVRELPPAGRLLPETLAFSRELFRHEDALAITHVVERPSGQRVLLTDLQRMDAATDQAAVAVQQNQARLALLLHPEPRSVLFLGLGTGISVAGSLAFPDLTRTAVELAQGVIEAMPLFAPLNQGVSGNTRIVRDDARRYLRADAQQYDVIVGDLFHPDLAGHSALLTTQQFARARARLNENGLFVQWLALNQFDAESLDSVLRGFKQEFPAAVLFMDGFRLALVGPKNSLPGAPAMLANLQRMSNAAQSEATGGEGAATWLGRYWGRINASAGPVQDEWAPHIEYRLPRARYGGELDLARLLEKLLHARPALDTAAEELGIAAGDRAAFERAYGASELALRGWLLTLRGSDEGARLLRLAYAANPRDRWIGFALADAMYATLPRARASGRSEQDALQAILEIRPDHADTLRRLWHLQRAAGNSAAAEQYRARLAQVSPLDKEIRALLSTP